MFSMSLVFVSVKWQKLLWNVMLAYPDDDSTGILPLPISSNCLEKLLQIDHCAIQLACSYLISVLTLSIKWMTEHAFKFVNCVDRGITGRVWRKSPTNKIIVPPNRFWFFRKSCNVRSSVLPKIFCVPSCTHPKLLICSAATLWPTQNFSKGCKLVFHLFACSLATWVQYKLFDCLLTT